MRVTLAALLLVSAPAAATAEPTCTDLEVRYGSCQHSAYLGAGEAVIEGAASAGGAGQGQSSGGPLGPGGTGFPNASAPICTPSSAGLTEECDPRDWFDVQVVTLADIARFRPAPGVQRMEPDGWVVVGLPANIYSLVDRQVVPGQLLGQSADVRFTPIAWHWDYGDGTTATRTTKGGTWAGLGLREFEATPTSHVYRSPGDYTVRLSIRYRAEYRIGGGAFVPIAGTIVLPANELRITAGGAKTVLVDRDCTVAPRGPGC